MKKIITFLFTLVLVVSMAIPAFACTSKMEIPDVPQISDIKFDIKIELPDNFWKNFKFDFGG